MRISMNFTGKSLFRVHRIYSSYLFYFTPCFHCSSYKSTLLLPKTRFPHKINVSNRRERDHMIEKVAKFEDLYSWQRAQSSMNGYILHDGPPYANGDVHIGHTVNKVLKDITVRQKLLQGYKVHFVPGWDCHGLPIELKVLKGSEVKSKNNDLAVRKKAYEFSQKTKEKQMTSFKEWGILADWKNSYITCCPEYVIEQLQIFQHLYDQGTIFQDHKPVYWSPSNRTSLAEAELEYNPSHVSPSVYVKLRILKCPEFLSSKLGANSSLSVVVWTTTPWSLPANQAVCYSDEKMYSIVHHKGNNEYYLVAEEMIPSLSSALKTEIVLINSFESSALKDLKYQHPIFKNRECSLFPATHVTMTKGTGLVHTAPNHGLDDYFVAKKQNLVLDACLVDDNGCFTNEAGFELAGKYVLEEGSDKVIKILGNDIVSVEDFVHSYPYDWRSKLPVIIKSSRQWFIDVQRFQIQAMECLENVKVFPNYLKNSFMNQLKSSPQWCISRQRSWGVPIPAFHTNEASTPVVHGHLTDHLCQLISKYGIHAWWERDIKDLIPSSLIEKCGLKDVSYKKGLDIMDIWLDSGISWKNALPEPQISDVCIEGIDQMRGWFNSSLMTSVALRGKAPYKSLVFHGFTTDAEGRKMSKSEGNIISPVDIICGSKKDKIPAYGIDVLRWWVASHACHHENIALKTQILEECSQNINKLRNVFKFLLGSLQEFSPRDAVSPFKLRPFDLYMLHSLQIFMQKVLNEYNEFQYKNVSKDIVNFTTNDISSFYCQLVKDRLYCDSKDSVERLSCQTVLYYILNTLVRSIGAICPHLAEEVVMHHPNNEIARQGTFRTSWPSLEDYLENIPSPTCVAVANEIKEAIVKTDIKTLSLHAQLVACDEVTRAVQSLNTNVSDDSGCTEFFQVASISFAKDTPEKAEFVKGHVRCHDTDGIEPFTVALYETEFKKCPRCRRFSSATASLCRRCLDVVNINSKIRSEL